MAGKIPSGSAPERVVPMAYMPTDAKRFSKIMQLAVAATLAFAVGMMITIG